MAPSQVSATVCFLNMMAGSLSRVDAAKECPFSTSKVLQICLRSMVGCRLIHCAQWLSDPIWTHIRPREMEYDMALAVLQHIPGVAPLQISVYTQAATLMHSGNLGPYLQSYDEYRHVEYW